MVYNDHVRETLKFANATGFFEVPDKSLRLEAFAVIRDCCGCGWAFDEALPRPIDEEEMRSRGGFAVKPEDAYELIDFSEHDYLQTFRDTHLKMSCPLSPTILPSAARAEEDTLS